MRYMWKEENWKKKNANWITLIPYLLVGFILPVYGKSYLCFDCDKRWKIKLF